MTTATVVVRHVNIGTARRLRVGERSVLTGIGKAPVTGPVALGPLGLAGVAGALLLLGRPFGFVALLGVIALMGMIQRNSVILIDQIEQDRARGVPAWDAIVESAVRRLRPIVLTAAAAVLAMIPL